MATSAEWSSVQFTAELDMMRQKYKEQPDMSQPSPKIQFEYACLLICSPSRADIREGVELLVQLYDVEFHPTEVLHRLALAHLKLGQYGQAKKEIDRWLDLEPKDGTARMLHSLIIDRATHDGLVGLFCAGLLVVGSTLLLSRRRG